MQHFQRQRQGADLKQQDSVVSVVSVVRDCEQLPAKTTEATKNNRVQRRKRPKQPENNRPNGENNRNNSPAVFSRSPRLFLLFYGPRCFRLAPGLRTACGQLTPSLFLPTAAKRPGPGSACPCTQHRAIIHTPRSPPAFPQPLPSSWPPALPSTSACIVPA